MEGDYLVEGEAGADLVAHDHQVGGVVRKDAVLVLEDHARLVLGYIVVHELDRLKRELGQHVIDEVRELLRVLMAHQEHMLHLLDLRQTAQVVVDDRVATDYSDTLRQVLFLLGNRGLGMDTDSRKNRLDAPPDLCACALLHEV